MAKRLTARTINKIRELHRDGMNGTAIAKRLGKSRPTVYKILNAAPSSNGRATSG